MSDIIEATSGLGKSYKDWKAAEKEKDKYKKEFFGLVDQEISVLAERIVEINVADYDEALRQVLRRYPRWTVEDARQVGPSLSGRVDSIWEFIIKESPEFKAHSFVNPEDGFVYTRQVQSGSAILDDERLQEIDPELYEQVTYVPTERRLRSLDELTPEQLAKLQEYMYEGRPITKLSAPRKAKPEDLE